jgi:hypothetical protein
MSKKRKRKKKKNPIIFPGRLKIKVAFMVKRHFEKE